MKQLQQGFTLIELMIVVAIIGILAALAVPAYQDYTIRSKVSEAASLAAAARTAVDVRYSETGTLDMPGTTADTRHVSLGLALAASYNAKYVSQVQISDDSGTVTVTMKTLDDFPASVDGDTVIYSPRRKAGNLEWVVSAGSSVIEKYRPKR